MSDIFKEVEEEVRLDEIKAFWSKYANLIVSAVLLIIVSVAGFKGWSYYKMVTMQANSNIFESILDNHKEGAYVKNTILINSLIKDSTGDYPFLARFQLAQTYNADGETNKAIGIYTGLINSENTRPLYRKIALISRGHLQVDTISYKELSSQLEDLLKADDNWSYLAHEILGISAIKSGLYRDADKHFDIIINADKEKTGDDIVARVSLIKKTYLSSRVAEGVTDKYPIGVKPVSFK